MRFTYTPKREIFELRLEVAHVDPEDVGDVDGLRDDRETEVEERWHLRGEDPPLGEVVVDGGELWDLHGRPWGVELQPRKMQLSLLPRCGWQQLLRAPGEQLRQLAAVPVSQADWATTGPVVVLQFRIGTAIPLPG